MYSWESSGGAQTYFIRSTDDPDAREMAEVKRSSPLRRVAISAAWCPHCRAFARRALEEGRLAEPVAMYCFMTHAETARPNNVLGVLSSLGLDPPPKGLYYPMVYVRSRDELSCPRIPASTIRAISHPVRVLMT